MVASASTAAEQQPSNPHVEIAPDDDPYSGDPAFFTDSDAASSTQSLSSSILNYQYENGRRYHAYREGEYILPNDDREQDRLDLNHHLCRLVVGGALFRAPLELERPARILDLGTGTGIWAIEMADEYPSAEVTGTDLSPIQSTWVPPNCYFEVDDYESEWDFSRPFDFIHARTLYGSVRDFPQLFERSLQNLANDGWAEFSDWAIQFFSDDGSLERAPNMVKWAEVLDEASQKFGKQMNSVQKYKQWLGDAGFKNVQEEVYKVPVNPWAKDRKMKELGRFMQANFLEGMEAHSLALLTRVLGWKQEEVQIFLAGVRQEVMDRSLHIYVKFYFVYGQKVEE